jgi:hypothetical protein
MVIKASDSQDLSETGWGIIFARDANPAIKEALSPLLELRQVQAGPYFKVLDGQAGYRAGETKTAFLTRHGSGGGRPDPARGLPYYLLLVGSPEEIPFSFQHQLDIQYAVGRLHFDQVSDYTQYAQSVVAVEKDEVKRPRQISFFSPTIANDTITQLATEHLVQPLYDKLKASYPDYNVVRFIGQQATKAQLKQLLGGDQAPALLFTAGQGLALPPGDSRQMAQQGALLCQDWPSPSDQPELIPPQGYLSGNDLSQDADVLGLLAFQFGACSAGTPAYDASTPERQILASQPFVANLAKKLLSHPRGSALAMVGNVGPVWGYSFFWPSVGGQITVFESTIARLLKGYHLGGAFKYFGQRYAEIGSELYMMRQEVRSGVEHDPDELLQLTRAYYEAGGWVIIGDPAVRVAI